MAKETTNYSFIKPDITDFCNVDDFNNNMDVIDAELKKAQDKAGNPTQVNGHTVESNVPANAKFTDTVYTHPDSGVTAGAYRKVTVNAQGHVTAGENPTLAISEGGTGASDVAKARNNLGLGNTTGALPVANGGTGGTDAASARNNLGLGNTSGALPVANGGTGSTTAAAALTALGAAPLANPVFTGTPKAPTGATDYTTLRLRNIYATTTDLTAGTSALTSGDICIIYE